jgi:hypothetical protein
MGSYLAHTTHNLGTMKTDRTKLANYEALKTMAILAMAPVLFGLLGNVKPLYFLALFLLAIGVFVEKWARAVSSGWLKFSHVVGAVNTRIVLGFIFFVFLTPLSLIYRMAHGDSLGLKKREDVKTYFSGRDHVYSARDLTNPW